MADYYPLIARAIAGLDPNAPGESRRALYERARGALIQQLRSVQPPLSESEITRERLSLEEAVRKVESEAAQRAREATRGSARVFLPPRQSSAPGGRRAGSRVGAPGLAAPASALAAVIARPASAAWPGGVAAQPARRRTAADRPAAAAAAAAGLDAGPAAAADP